MAKPWAKKFYNSVAWRKVRELRIFMADNICEVEGCEEPIDIVHHTIHLTPDNINDPNVSLNVELCRGVCREHHNFEHEVGYEVNAAQGLYIDDNGEIIERELKYKDDHVELDFGWKENDE